MFRYSLPRFQSLRHAVNLLLIRITGKINDGEMCSHLLKAAHNFLE